MKYKKIENNVAVEFIDGDVVVEFSSSTRTGVVIRTKYVGTKKNNDAVNRIINRWLCGDPSVYTISYGIKSCVDLCKERLHVRL